MITALIKAMAAWMLLLAGAILNGIAREKLITPFVGDQAAHAVSP
jgi:hypothetical protein